MKRILDDRKPWKAPGRAIMARAAVAMVFTNLQAEDWEAKARVLFVRRALKKDDPWSGHMAFPGGRKHKEDTTLLDTAMRETREEIGLDLPGTASMAGRLSDVITRTHERFTPMVVTPYVFNLETGWEGINGSLRPNEELAEATWVPFSFLADPGNRAMMKYRSGGMNWKMPCYDYKGRCIWGISLLMVDDLLWTWKGKPKGLIRRVVANRPSLVNVNDKDLVDFYKLTNQDTRG